MDAVVLSARPAARAAGSWGPETSEDAMARLIKFLEGPPHYLVLRTLNAVRVRWQSRRRLRPATVPVSTSEGHKIVFKGDFTLSAGTGDRRNGDQLRRLFRLHQGVEGSRLYGRHLPSAFDAIDAAGAITGTETFNNLFFRNATVKGTNAGDYMFALEEGGKALGRGGDDEVDAFGFGASALRSAAMATTSSSATARASSRGARATTSSTSSSPWAPTRSRTSRSRTIL